jgi:hypothetical protein
MLEVFSKHYIRDEDARAHDAFSIEPSVQALIQLFGGSSFSRGMYRVILESEKHAWDLTASKAFPAFGNRLSCFAYDWLGRIFALDPERLIDGLPGVVMLEPGTGQALEIPCHLSSFHDEELIEFSDAALAAEFYENWLSQGGATPSYSQCIGYLRPLFLSGKDEVTNLAVSDMNVYWEIASQSMLKVRGMSTTAP